GQVKVFTRMLNQEDPQYSTMFPGGDLATVNSSGQLAQLESFGMLGVELEDGSGNVLNLDGNSTATVRMPIAANQLSTAPDSIPLLHFDEEKGVWIQDGYAHKSGSFYEGTVSHFSWWNCDIPLPTPTPIISGRVVDCAGNPIPGCVVSVNGIYTLNTNSAGVYSSWIPSGINVVVSVDPQLNSNIYPAVNSQSLTTAPGLNAVPDIVLNCPALVSGQAVNCEGSAVSVYVRALWPNNGNTMLLNFPNGDFQLSVSPNQTVQLTLFNGTEFKDTTITSLAWGSSVNLGNIFLCNTSGGNGCAGVTNVTDIDGNVYDVVSIAGACWMAENLKTTRYRNGCTIATGLSDAQWNQASTGAYASYNNLNSNSTVYGHLYNWYTVVDPAGLCPTGWHVPSDGEWQQMIDAIGGQAYAGGHLKQTGTVQTLDGLWQSPNTGADNLTGFDGLPGGYRNYDGSFAGLGYSGYWASSSVGNSPNTAWFRSINYNDASAIKNDNDKRIGYSVRCVKD
ncbi:MAG: FISUMP domain-containing protein, partial [Bacteroidota bacterium]